MSFKTKMQYVIRQRMRMNRGLAWLSYFIQPVSTVIGVAVGGIIGGLIATVLVLLGFFIVGIFLGYTEEKWIKSWQYENEYNVKELNEYFERRFNTIEAKLDEMKK